MKTCAVMVDLNRHEMEQDKLLAIQEVIEKELAERADELMQAGQEHYPFSEGNLLAFTESANLTDVLELLARKQYEDAGALLHTRLIAHAKKSALVSAIIEAGIKEAGI